MIYRVCPGKELANEALYMTVACVLWALNIEPACGKDGRPILPSRDDLVQEGIVVYVSCWYLSWLAPNAGCSRPKPFECMFVARSLEVAGIVQSCTRFAYE